MSSSDITINDFDDEKLIPDIGERLSIFRKLVRVTPSQLARNLNKETSHIKAIEDGKKHLEFADLIYLQKKYGLNPNWLTSGKGNMFNHKGPHTPAFAFNAGNRVHYKNPKLWQWLDFFELIAVPSIFEELFHKLETAKQIFADDIKLFQYQNEVGIISEPQRPAARAAHKEGHEGIKRRSEETEKRRNEEARKRKSGEGMDSKGSVMVKLLIVIIFLIIWLFFYARKIGLFAYYNERRTVR
jgi:hypothetical protein